MSEKSWESEWHTNADYPGDVFDEDGDVVFETGSYYMKTGSADLASAAPAMARALLRAEQLVNAILQEEEGNPREWNGFHWGEREVKDFWLEIDAALKKASARK